MTTTNPNTPPVRTTRNDKRLSETTRCTLEYLVKHGPCGFDELHSKFCTDSTSRRAREQYRANLTYLVGAGHLKSTGHGHDRKWEIDYSPRVVVPAAAKPCAMAPEVFSCSVRVPPPQYDRMHGPAFTYTLSQPTRPGALDFKRVGSVGYSC